MKKYQKALLFILFFVFFSFTFTPVTNAASISLNSFNNGGCYKAGSTETISWNQSPEVYNARVLWSEDGIAIDPNDPYVKDSFTIDKYIAWKYGGQTGATWKVKNLSATTKYRIWVLGYTQTTWEFLGMAISSVPFSIDGSAPTIPVPQLIKKTHSELSFDWQPVENIGCMPLKGYRIYRGGVLVKTLGPETTSYSDTELSSNTDYVYRIEAFDDFYTTTSSSYAVATEATPAQTPSSAPQTQPIQKPTINKSNNSDTSALPSSNQASTATIQTEETPVNTPVLSSIKADDKEIALTSEHPVIIRGKTLKLSGTGLPNQNLVINVYSLKTVYEITADNNGNWSEEIKTQNLESGDHRITIAEKDQSGALSTERDVFSFSLQDEQPQSSKNKNNILMLVIILASLGIIVLAIIYRQKIRAIFKPLNKI